jgi:hypothetical protein
MPDLTLICLLLALVVRNRSMHTGILTFIALMDTSFLRFFTFIAIPLIIRRNCSIIWSNGIVYQKQKQLQLCGRKAFKSSSERMRLIL